MSPSFCKTTVTCASVLPANTLACPELDNNGEYIWNFGPSEYDSTAPGTYEFTYTVGIEGVPETNKQFTITIVLSDPCDPPISLTPIVLEN